MFERVGKSPLEWAGPPRTSFLEISDWGLDDAVMGEATAVLSKRFAVKQVTYEEADFDTWTWDSLSRDIRALPLPVDDIDAYVVILRDWRGDEIGHSVHQLGGLGLYRRDGTGGPRLGAFAAYRIAIIDARSGEIMASRPVLTQIGQLPRLPVAPSIWPNTQNDVTDAQRTMLQTCLRRLIDATLPPTLKGLMAGH
ncbi:MAG: hypothetical protein ABSD74_00935 [Rhizomicrobium sp.]|jgi:hypothetical protein